MKDRITRQCCGKIYENNLRVKLIFFLEFLEGYKINPLGDGCIPHCTQKCKNGTCIAPDKCKCEHGFGGPSCDISKF